MDETTRRREREAQRDGGELARVQLATERRREGRGAEALQLLEGASTPAALALRAELQLEAGRLLEAARDGRAAARLDPRALSPEQAERLTRALLEAAGPDPRQRILALARAAALGEGASEALAPLCADPEPLVRGLLARVRALAPGLEHDPSPYVRAVARQGWQALGKDEEPTATRLFGAHGPDFETGLLVCLEAGYPARLSCFEAAFFRAVDRLLTGRSDHDVAYGGSYGLALSRGEARGDLEERVAEWNEAEVLPFPLAVSGPRPYDPLQGLAPSDTLSADDERLASRFARDLGGHPARLGATPPPGAPLHRRLLSLFRPGRIPGEAELEPFLEEARASYGPVGYRALERFVERATAEAPGGPPGAPLGPRGGLRRPPPEEDPR